MPNFAFLRSLVGLTLISTHSISLNEVQFEIWQYSTFKHYDVGSLDLGFKIL